ncbi:phage protein [Paenibacillus apiarius]|uniref:Uncharacterized protein n=1 Tax=Paenibacillus apiarius TaxID=46240 RepID=A0ABT4DX07_9BACL|nr:hypothetical protein [Paenibacillus apiarius]MBN3523483.1 hypothetical protein [Paenibacillus apiarius]MCY9517937.1 hypothetical protein [Paenibacillus apiarius]MCY9521889.1 hypothetical protein [Paenibacillus apiarius]MCY9554846.1 hypothetical protein [Paenibacillus apiarius]MCY9559025.1 hypothetical protein [Paenibacillus apiarius]
MEYLYKRNCEVLIGGYRFTYEDLSLRVVADFDDDKEPNESTVELYNLSKHTLANLKTGMRVIVNAGYGTDLGTVLQGNIVEVRTKREQMDRVTTIQVKDDLKVSVYDMVHTYRPGSKASEIIRDLLNRAQIPHGELRLPADHTYAKGFVVKGDPLNAIRRAAAACGLGTYTMQGKLYFQAANMVATSRTFVALSPESGLIDSPQSFEEGKTKGVRATSLLNHRLHAGAQVRLVSEDFEGVYKVKQGKHTISGEQFITEVDLVKE